MMNIKDNKMGRKAILLALMSTLFLMGEDNILVKIKKDIPYVIVNDSGHKVKIMRIQDTAHMLTDDFAKTSRPCPPFCIQPIRPINGVQTFAELELIDFYKNKVASHKGILADARLPDFYNVETIPGAINIPFTIIQTKSKKIKDALFKALGAKKKADGSYDFSNAKEITVFDNGLWDAQASTFIKGIIKEGYPKNKIFYYRSGMQGWKLLGLTTVVHKANEVK